MVGRQGADRAKQRKRNEQFTFRHSMETAVPQKIYDRFAHGAQLMQLNLPTAERLIRYVLVPRSWVQRWRQREHLASLDDRLLKDVGLTRADVGRETAKPFWR